MWFGTGDGREGGEPLQSINLDVLERIAVALDVEACKLLVQEKS
jgi:hypothetical protein